MRRAETVGRTVGLVVLMLFVWAGTSLAASPQLKATGSKLCFSCHGEEQSRDFSRTYVHEPVQQDDCITCHNPHTSKFNFMLADEVKTLCYSCHTDEKTTFEQSSNIHTAVQNGSCTACHDPHSSDNENLQKATGPELCYSCHTDMQQEVQNAGGDIHAPVEAGECLKCHDAHASPYTAQLRRAPKDLCFTCHDAEDPVFEKAHGRYPVMGSDCLSCHAAHATDVRTPELPNGLTLRYVHQPFAKKMCSSCHVSSDSPDPFRLAAPEKELCFRCHNELKAQVNQRPVVHTPVKEGRCDSCHAPHASKNARLLRTTGRNLCASCHPDIMNRLAAPYTHPPAVEGKCVTCHDPHSSENEGLLVDTSINVCTTCHETQGEFTHPVGEDAVNPRTQKIVTCVSCHDAHGTDNEAILLANRRRDLCVQCHILK